MKEFGSDFHCQDNFMSHQTYLNNVFGNAIYLANGRLCLVALIRQYNWKRIWIPEYFCYEVIASIKKFTGIEILYYNDFPTNDDRETVKTLPFRDGDVLMRVNYFGIRDFRNEKDIPVQVIEDHSHDIMGNWALHSNADWCIASLRKTLPIPEGGMMWSPKGLKLDISFDVSLENTSMADNRWKAMEMKNDYLQGKNVQKDAFRKIYMKTEDELAKTDLSLIDRRSMAFIKEFDISGWYGCKRKNWEILSSLVKKTDPLFTPEDSSCNLFSFIVTVKDKACRDELKKKMIAKSIFPAILWDLPESVNKSARDISGRILSIHCDGRYLEEDMVKLANMINQLLNK